LVEFVVSLNLHRRHLSSGQRAACGTEIEERLAKEARGKQIAAGARGKEGGRPSKNPGGNNSTRVSKPPPVETKPEPKARDQAAKIVGSNPRYIQDAKTIKEKTHEEPGGLSPGRSVVRLEGLESIRGAAPEEAR
jgi:hypothetical protein